MVCSVCSVDGKSFLSFLFSFFFPLFLFFSQGRNPFFLEPAVIITITDGNKLTHSSGVSEEVRGHGARPSLSVGLQTKSILFRQ